MRGTKLNQPTRRGVTAVALLLFLTGSNYCLASVLSGGTMACLAPPGAGAPSSSHCGHCGSDRPSAPTTARCCVTMDQVPGPTVAKADVTSGVAAVVTGTESSVLARRPDANAPHADESPPAAPDPPAPSLGRAPPLS